MTFLSQSHPQILIADEGNIVRSVAAAHLLSRWITNHQEISMELESSPKIVSVGRWDEGMPKFDNMTQYPFWNEKFDTLFERFGFDIKQLSECKPMQITEDMMRDSHFILGVSKADTDALRKMYGGKYENKVFLFSDLGGRNIDFGDPFHQKDFDVNAAERMLQQMEEICDSQEHLSVDSGEPWHESMRKRLEASREERELGDVESELGRDREKM